MPLIKLLRSLPALVAIALLLGTAAQAQAQRGGAFASDESPELHTSSHYPGSFDTNMLEPEEWSLDLPWGNVWYGATEDLSIGTNLIAVAGPATINGYGLNMSLRYRVWARRNALSTLTLTAGYAKSEQEDLDLDYGGLTSSTALLRDWGVFTASISAMRLGQVSSTYQPGLMATTVDSASATGLAFACTYDRFFSKRFGVQATVGSMVAVLGSVDTATISATSTQGSFEGLAERSAGRFVLQARAGRWLIQGGSVVVASEVRAPQFYLSFQWTSKP